MPSLLSSSTIVDMIKNGTWKSEPANEEHWEVDWSIEEPDPEYIDEEALVECKDTLVQ